MARGQKAIAVPALAFAPVKRVSRWESGGRMERLTTDIDFE
jgi:hypothetical protein